MVDFYQMLGPRLRALQEAPSKSKAKGGAGDSERGKGTKGEKGGAEKRGESGWNKRGNIVEKGGRGNTAIGGRRK